MLPALLLSPLARVAGVALLVVGAFGYGWFVGDRNADRAHKAALAAELQEHLNEVMYETQRANQIAADFAQWKRRHSGKASGYRGAAGELRTCAIPDAFVRLYNSSSQGLPVSETPGGIACQASATPADTVAAAVAENNASCVEYAEQLNKLIDFEEGRK